jgi:hypothetical protein
VLEPRFEQTQYLIGDRAPAMQDGKWGLVDREGRTIIPFEHAKLHAFGEWFVAADEESTTFFSKDGAKLFRVPYTVLGEIRDGCFTIANSFGGPFGYMDVTGKVLLEPRFGFAAPFSDGLAIVDDDGTWGIIDRSGAMKKRIEIDFVPSAGASHFAKNGVAYIESCGQFGLVNRSGRILLEPELEEMFGFGEDLIFARWPSDLD